MAEVKSKGLTPKLDLSDVEKYPKVRGAANFLIDMFVAGGFPMMVGDASGGPHCGRVAESWAARNADAFRKAFALCGDPRGVGAQEPSAAIHGPRWPRRPKPHAIRTCTTSRALLAGAGAACGGDGCR